MPPTRAPRPGLASLLFLVLLCSRCATSGPGPEMRAQPAEPEAQVVLTPIAPVQLIERIKSSTAAATVLNVWATWCAPCTEELPDFVRFRREYRARGVDVVLLSGDFKDQRRAAAAFLRGVGVDFETFVNDGTDADLINSLDPEWSGALPVTVVYRPGGARDRFLEGRVSYGALEREVLRVLDARP